MEIANIGPEKESDIQESQDDDSYKFEFVGSRLADQKELDKFLEKWYFISKIPFPKFFKKGSC